MNLLSILFRSSRPTPPADPPAPTERVVIPLRRERLPEDFVDPTGLQRVYAVRVVQGDEAAYPFLVQACAGDVKRASDCILWAVPVVRAEELAARAFGSVS